MTAAVHPAVFRSKIAPVRQPAAAKIVPRPGILRRIFDVVFETRQRHAERVVEAYLARSGHRITDSIEREIDLYLFNGGWNRRG